jgi:uncharacterized membrane protein YfcA
MTTMLELMLPLLGFLIGTAAALTGIGGGVFIVPLLTMLYAFAPPNAAGTSLTTIVFTAVAATANYSRQKRIYYKTGLALALTAAPGAILGAYSTTVISPVQLGLGFGAFLILIAAQMMISSFNAGTKTSRTQERLGPSPAKTDAELISSRKTIVIGAGLSFFGGLASGLLGIGGGVLLVPIMTFALAMPIHTATATSMFTMIFTSISGVTEHFQAHQISFEFAVMMGVGSIIGAQLGAYTSRRISGRSLRIIFAAMLIIAGIKMIDQYKTAL